MKLKLLYSAFAFFTIALCNAQTISIVGPGVNGWPENQTTPEITLSTTDNVTFSIQNLVVTDGFVKFRRDLSWTINWGGNTFPSGQGIPNGDNIPTVAGTYDVTFNLSNATYTFINATGFPSIGIWGPAVDSQNGYAGADVDMSTTDGINYTLSGFYFSSGQAYFRQDNATNFVWGGTAYPTGTAVMNGPSLFIPGGEHFVTFNRITGDYSFSFPSVGILGTALQGYDVADTDLITNDGFFYSISDLHLAIGTVKFRKDNAWTINWGADAFPYGTGVQDGANIPVNIDAFYSISFNRLSGAYEFGQLLNKAAFSSSELTIAPNPAQNNWNFNSSNETINRIEILDFVGKSILTITPDAKFSTIDVSSFPQGIYFAKIRTQKASTTYKLIKI